MAVRNGASAFGGFQRTTNLPTITSMTIMGWYYHIGANVLGVPSALFSFGAHLTAEYQLEVLTDSDMSLNAHNFTTGVGGSIVPTTTWFHAAMTIAGTGAGQFLSYLNAVLDITNSGTASATNSELFIADNGYGEEYWNGRFAAIKIWDAVLTQAEILKEKQQYEPVRKTNLNSFYPMIDAATAATDFSGNGRTLTVNGSQTTEDGPPIPWRLPLSPVIVRNAVRRGSYY